MHNSWQLIVVGAAVLLVLFFLSSSGKKPPVFPLDSLHAGLKTDEACLTCHAQGKQAPLKTTHPPKEQCMTCHKPAKPE
jgi:hypothetical protein